MKKPLLLKKCAVYSVLSVGISMMGSVQASLLEDVKSRDTLRCGVSSDKAGFSHLTDDGEWGGMDVDLCRSVAAAVLGDASKVDFVITTAKNRFTALASGEVDVLARATTWTASRDANLGVDFKHLGFMTAKV